MHRFFEKRFGSPETWLRSILGWMPWQKATKKSVCNYYARNHIIQSQMLWKKRSIIICHFLWRRHRSSSSSTSPVVCYHKKLFKYQTGSIFLSVVKKEMFFNVKNRHLEQTVFLLRRLGGGELEKNLVRQDNLWCKCHFFQIRNIPKY